jgi:hypothetical protein
MPDPKRGRTNGRRRNVVCVSLDSLTLMDLDKLQETFSNWGGRKLSRSAVIKKLVRMGRAAVGGEIITDLRRY